MDHAARRRRDRLEREIERLAALEADTAARRAQIADELREMYAQAMDMIRANPGPAVKGRLRSRREYDTLKTRMQAPDAIAAPRKRRRGRPMESGHPFTKRLAELGLTVVDVAKELDVSRTSVRSWYAEGDAGRAIPERHAATLERKPYSIPRSAWRNGITD